MLENDESLKMIGQVNCKPLSDELKDSEEIVRVLCADPATAFQSDHTAKIKITAGAGKTKQQAALPVYDPDWHLCMETLELHKERWSDPPGAVWIQYVRQSDCFAVKPKHRPTSVHIPNINIARYLIDSPVLPLVQDTLPVAELTRRYLMKTYRRCEEERLRDDGVTDFPLPRSDVFSGKNEVGEALKGHKHAYFLPTDEDDDGRLDHVTIIADMNFSPSEIRAIDRLQSINRGLGLPKLELMLIGLGWLENVQSPLFGPAKEWISATPFVVTRHQKKRGTKRDGPELLGFENRLNFAQAVLREELSRLAEHRDDFPKTCDIIIELLPDNRMSARDLRPIQFKRSRRKKGDDGARRIAAGFKIVFPAPVPGPICLGHSAHFGMGLFLPEA